SHSENKKLVDWLAKLDGRSNSDECREIFVAGILEKRKEIALLKYVKQEASLEKAAEISGLNVWEFLDLLKKTGTALNLSAGEIIAASKRA
ncbi:UPF0175 family protein, partial [Candidatus Micrarchaeota archaeon]|nr:UPF0175 family protein [Candidatus Micrarchaeota archaeon]